MLENRFQSRQRADVRPDEITNTEGNPPVIYFGTTREVASRQSIKEQHFVRASDDKAQVALTPLSKEAKLLTLYVADIPTYMDDSCMEKLLKAAAKLQTWKRIFSGTGSILSCGFATYEDPDNLSRALTIISAVQLPVVRGSDQRKSFFVKQDPMSERYIEDYLLSKADTVHQAKERNMILSATGQVEKLLKDINNLKYSNASDRQDASLAKSVKTSNVEENWPNSVTIMLSIEDELGDIPEEQRASIANEITCFRERSAKRDQDRARQIADLETRRLEYERANRSDSLRLKSQVDGVAAVTLIRSSRTKEYTYAIEKLSEQEIESRRLRTSLDNAAAQYKKEEVSWSSREGPRIESLKNEVRKVAKEARQEYTEKLYQLEKLAKFDDDKAAYQTSEEFFRDRSSWTRVRTTIRRQEKEQDARDAALDRMPNDIRQTTGKKTDHIPSPLQVGPVRLALSKMPEDNRRKTGTNKDVILETDDVETPKRAFTPMEFDDAQPNNHKRPNSFVIEDGRLIDIANSIPSTKDELWKHVVKWELLSADTLAKIQNFVGKKIVEVIGLEEHDLIAAIMSIIHAQGTGQNIQQELEAAIGDPEESEITAIKIWRYLLLSIELQTK